MKDTAAALQPNTAGLFLLIRKMTTDKVLADLRGSGGTLMRHLLRRDQGSGAAARRSPPRPGETVTPAATLIGPGVGGPMAERAQWALATARLADFQPLLPPRGVGRRLLRRHL